MDPLKDASPDKKWADKSKEEKIDHIAAIIIVIGGLVVIFGSILYLFIKNYD